ncbi:MAG: dicarboxylate/amino acid:cation symporter [Pseudomonadota bacterium]|nr:dicarboxylate/amino acid:cation symporter [Pseudomonadota bacterium]
MKLHHQIFLAMLLGAVFGWMTSTDGILLGLNVMPFYSFLGDLFLNALKMIVIPLIMTAIICGMIGVGQDAGLGKLGLKTVSFYLGTSLIAVLVGLIVVNILTPGVIDGQPARDMLGLAANTDEALAKVEGRSSGDFAQIFLQLFPPNLVSAAVNNQLLGLIVFSLLFGYYLRTLAGKAGDTLRDVMQGSYDVIMSITMLIIRFAPIGVFGLIAAVVARTGFDALQPLAWFFLAVVLALFIHAFVILPLMIQFLAKRSPTRMIQAMTPALLTAFSSASSAATLPLNMECLQNRAGVSKRVSSFVLPLGATVNMNGTALYECVAVVFIAQAYGMELSFATQFLIVLTAMMTSIGVAAVPAASLVAITLILSMVGLPAEAIGLILVTDRILDMCRTSVNIWGDAVGAAIIARSEGEEDVLSLPVDDMEAKQLAKLAS